MTQSVYVLMAEAEYERLKRLFAEQCYFTEAYEAQSAVAGAAGWDDPEMDIYDDYDAHKSRL